MSLIINIETATQIGSVSLTKDGQLVDFMESKDGNTHAAQLAPMIDTLIKRNNLTYGQLSAIAISEGPGSYTGLRIGTSTAKGLCFALDIPLITIGTLQSLAAHAIAEYDDSFKGIFQPMIDARRMEVYSQSFDADAKALNEVEAVIVDEESFASVLSANKVLFFGDGAEKCKETIIHPNAIFIDDLQVSALGMIKLSYQKFLNKEFANVAYFEPFYLKEFVAAVSKVKGLD
jgi:tRNA threonylcarbamoyladenosine biosynthesis protein TsaB